MTFFHQNINWPGFANLFISLGGIAGGTGLTIIRAVHPYQSGILFMLGVVSYGLAIYASIIHIKQINKKKK